ncbi:putative DNA polymerase III, epsilon subunit [uncultured Desulfatiglans sp.]|nr:putative DNA polymerase III, epsilon subunit [uncultured Desulfatiglans sp.]
MINLFRRKTRSEPTTGPGDRSDLPASDASYVILDTELTGLDRKRDSILSIGAIEMTEGRIEMGRTFYRLVRPGSEMKHDAIVIHEITPSEVVEKPLIDDIISEFVAFCGDAVLVGHYVSIDLHFINRELKRILGAPLTNPVLDTLTLVDWIRWNTPNQGDENFTPKNYQLYEIAKDLGIPVQGAHNALMDAFMTAQVFQRLLPRLTRQGIRTLGELLKVGNPSRKLNQPGMVI